jgi:hypothetical protein
MLIPGHHPHAILGCIVAASIAAASSASAALLDALLLPAIPVQPVLPRAKGTCWDGLTDDVALQRLSAAADSSRVLRLDNSASALLRLRLDETDGLCDLSLDFQDGAGQASSR